MPTYTFKNRTTGDEWTTVITMAEREEVLSDPNIMQLVVNAPSLASVERLGMKKPDREFRDMVSYIKKRNPGSTINDM